jgi:hypothetical protein
VSAQKRAETGLCPYKNGWFAVYLRQNYASFQGISRTYISTLDVKEPYFSVKMKNKFFLQFNLK